MIKLLDIYLCNSNNEFHNDFRTSRKIRPRSRINKLLTLLIIFVLAIRKYIK